MLTSLAFFGEHIVAFLGVEITELILGASLGGKGARENIWLILVGIPPAIVIGRELLRQQVRASAILLSREQYPDVYTMMEDMAERIGLMKPFGKRKWKRLELYLQNGNGVLNAYASQASGKGFVTLYSELFSDLYANDRDGLAFVLGHELAHIQLWHTNILYQLSICYINGIPVIGTTLSRLREMSCDHYGATLSPRGGKGLLLMMAGRHNYLTVNLSEFLRQAPKQQSWLAWLMQLVTATHPYMVYRIPRLYQLGLLEPPSPLAELPGSKRDE